MEDLMFCSHCDELIKGSAYVCEDEEYCSKACLLAARDEIEGDLAKYEEDREEEFEEY